MALHPDFPKSPYAIPRPDQRWFPAAEDLRTTAYEKLLPPLVANIRQEIGGWRERGYPDATATSRALLQWWFRTDHMIETADGRLSRFQYYFAQREAVETVIWLYDVRRARDKFDLMRFDASGAVSAGMFPEDWPRYVGKMATGSGKTKVLSLLIAWSYFHRLYEADSALARNMLVIAPNIIVLDRLRADFDGLKIFFNDPVLPDNGFAGRNWRDDFQITLHIQDDVRIVWPIGNLFLTNIHRVYLGDLREPSLDDDDLSDYFLAPFGPKPAGKTTDSQTDLGEIVREIDELAVFNDEAHHVHDERMAWFKSIQDIHHRMLQKDTRLALQIDVTATPKHNNGAIFVQTVSDYPLVEAIHQNVVKHPTLPDAASIARLNEQPSAIFEERYADYLRLGVEEWRKSAAEHEALGKKARDELEKLRRASNEIDGWESPYKAIVSVLMLKEGWDVRNVTTIVGLRAYNAPSNILPEQTLGRGLRRMYFGSDTAEHVSIMGIRAFMEFVESIKTEGVEFERKPMGQDAARQQSLVVEVDEGNPDKDLDALDIAIPRLSRRFNREYKDLAALDPAGFTHTPIPLKPFTPEETREIVFKTMLDGEVHHTVELDDFGSVDHRPVVGFFARQILKELRLVGGYDLLYPQVRALLRDRLFENAPVDLDDPMVLRNLAEPDAGKIVFDRFKAAINALTVRDSGSSRIENYIRLRHTRPFRTENREYLPAKRSVFNMMVPEPTGGGFELKFARFLDDAPDVASFAKNYLAVGFKIDYVKAEGDLSSYVPDFLVKTPDGTVWIVETKGRAEIDLPQKMTRLRQWCTDATEASQAEGGPAYRFVYVDQGGFERHPPTSFAALVAGFTEYQA
ncbi:MAG: DEAD/DEAH box helicase family protein [Nitrococcus mobilis]|nr:DEAD/DEAH box helicase family protein [Nitrococcus mobilis]